ncbi:hypothetical protein BU17DRAFT_57949 [Hysterangium stoloniferum]|nr:hypothetical protein BU17DRAFT_57949 [Hysterangium stoloniferum]
MPEVEKQVKLDERFNAVSLEENSSQPGAPFAPGKWPTPELSLTPTNRYAICTSRTYTSETIQSALDSLGPSSILYLPASTVWSITSPIALRDHQELATWGYPTDESHMARLEAGKECYPHIINARAITGAAVRNVVVDGGQQKYGYEPKCGVMLQSVATLATLFIFVIDRCIIRHPRHWSCIQAFEGSQNVRITNNRIGPAGIGANRESGKWADGISYACSNGLVAGNEIIDATDGAIVIFGAPGTLVISNTIISHNRLTLGAINMVDWAPHDGNYTQTRVINNTIKTIGPSGYFKTGIGQGPSVWWTSPSPGKINSGAIVMNNLIDSQAINDEHGAFGYGFAVASDVRDWICVGNVSKTHVRYEGDISKSLPNPNVAPGPFVHNISQNKLILSDSLASPSNGQSATQDRRVILQSHFAHGRGRISSLISISPGLPKVLSYQAGQYSLEKGQHTCLDGIAMSHDQNNMICIREHREPQQFGIVLWENGLADNHQALGQLPQKLVFSNGGKLCVVSTDVSPPRILFDFMPYMPFDGKSDKGPSLILSNANPYLTVMTPESSLIFASSYIFSWNAGFRLGNVVARTCFHDGSQKTLLYTLSPYCQFVILRSKVGGAFLPSLPLVWPDPTHEAHWEWEIIWATPNPRTDRRDDPVMYFQGDGNLASFSSLISFSSKKKLIVKQGYIFRWQGPMGFCHA